jgi:hypothetical protein
MNLIQLGALLGQGISSLQCRYPPRTTQTQKTFLDLSIVLTSKYMDNTAFRKLDLFPSSVEGRETPNLLGSLEGANIFQ